MSVCILAIIIKTIGTGTKFDRYQSDTTQNGTWENDAQSRLYIITTSPYTCCYLNSAQKLLRRRTLVFPTTSSTGIWYVFKGLLRRFTFYYTIWEKEKYVVTLYNENDYRSIVLPQSRNMIVSINCNSYGSR